MDINEAKTWGKHRQSCNELFEKMLKGNKD